MKHGSLTKLYWSLPSVKGMQQAHKACAGKMMQTPACGQADSVGKPNGTGDARSSNDQKRWVRKEQIDDTMARHIKRDQNEDGAGGDTTGDMGELKKKKCQNPTRLAERIHMQYSIVRAAPVHRPSNDHLIRLAVPGSGRPHVSCSTESMG